MNVRPKILILLLLSASPLAWGGMYKWVDEKGVTHYGDTMPPQAVTQGTTELNKRGMVIKKTDRALTPEEIKARDDAAAKKKEEEQRLQEQKRKDKALLDSYTTEKDIDLARDRNLQATQNLIDSTEVRVKSVQGRLDGLRKQADVFAKKQKPVPPDLTADIKAAEAEIQHMQESIAKQRLEKAAIKARYDEDKKRFHELRSGAPQ